MSVDQRFRAENLRRKIAEMQEQEEAAEREAAKQRYLEEMKRKPHALPRKPTQ